jgi:hypothetical protein
MITFLLILFTGTYSVIGERQTAAVEREVGLQAGAVADRIGYELDLALTQGEGYSREFELRDTIGGSSYNVTVQDGTVALEWAESVVFASTAADGIDGTITPGTNELYNTGETIEVAG